MDNWVALKIQIIVNLNLQYVFLNNDKSSIYILVVDITYLGLHFYIFYILYFKHYSYVQ